MRLLVWQTINECCEASWSARALVTYDRWSCAVQEKTMGTAALSKSQEGAAQGGDALALSYERPEFPEANNVRGEDFVGEVEHLLDSRSQYGGECAARMDGVCDSDPIDDGAQLAFLNGEVHTEDPPCQHHNGNLQSTGLSISSDSEGWIIDIYLQTGQRRGARAA